MFTRIVHAVVFESSALSPQIYADEETANLFVERWNERTPAAEQYGTCRTILATLTELPDDYDAAQEKARREIDSIPDLSHITEAGTCADYLDHPALD